MALTHKHLLVKFYNNCFQHFYELRGSTPTVSKIRQNAATEHKNIFNLFICMKNTIYSKTPQDTLNILWGFRFAVFSSYKDGGALVT